MSAIVKLPTQLRASAGGEGAVEVDGSTVGEALEALYTAYPELRDRISDEHGTLRRFVNVYVDSEDIRFGELLETPIGEGAELQVVPAVAGG